MRLSSGAGTTQLEIPVIFSMETDGLGDLCHGSCGTMYWCSCGVDSDDKVCDGCGGSIISSSHHESGVTMESATKQLEYGCRISVELGTGLSDGIEVGVCGSMNNGCQGVERENQDDGIGGGCGGYDEETEIGSWIVLGGSFQATRKTKNIYHSALLMSSTDKDKTQGEMSLIILRGEYISLWQICMDRNDFGKTQ